MLLIVAGTSLFLMARNGLASLANGTQTLPVGMGSFVQRADYFSAQSTLGLTLIGLGVAVGLVASIRHALRRRAQRGTPAAYESSRLRSRLTRTDGDSPTDFRRGDTASVLSSQS